MQPVPIHKNATIQEVTKLKKSEKMWRREDQRKLYKKK